MGVEFALPVSSRVILHPNLAVVNEAAGGTGGVPVLPMLVSVTGHREIRPEHREQVEKQVRSVLKQLAESVRKASGGAGDNEPRVPIVLVTGLAEGADQLVARVALESEIGATLYAVLPMPREIYERDFVDPAALLEFRRLWDKAAYRGEIPVAPEHRAALEARDRTARERQFEALGGYLAQHSYVLIALWDGVYRDLTGGTSQVVSLKLRGYMEQAAPDADGNRPAGRTTRVSTIGPVYHIVTPRVGEMQPADAFEVKVHLPEGLPVSKHELKSPKDDRGTHEVAKRLRMFNEDLRTLGEQLAGERREGEQSVLTDAETPADVAPLRRAYGYTDAMSVHFKRRSEWVLRMYFFLVLFAGLAGAVSSHYRLLYPDAIPWTILAAYLTAIGGIYVLFFLSLSRQYHKKHLDYRALAEGLRVQMFWRLSGIPAGVAEYYLQNQASELDWIRIGLRSLDMTAPPGTPPPLDSAVGIVRMRWISSQMSFYKRKAQQARKVMKLLTPIGTVAINIAVFWGGIKVLAPVMDKTMRDMTGAAPLSPSHVGFVGLLIVLSSAAPLAVAFMGYRHYRGLVELTSRYSKMMFFYSLAQRNLDHFGLKLLPGDHTQVRQEIYELGRESLTENSDWLIMHRGRRLDLPR